MVLIKNLTQTQVNGIADNFKGEVITNTDSNKLMFNNGTEFTYLVYSDLNNVITGLSGVSATNLTGTLQTAAQPNVTSLGTLTGLTVNNVLSVAQHNGVDKGLSLGGTLVTSTAAQLNYVNTTPGTAEAGKALITDSNNSIVGLTNVETDNLTVNGTLVTSSAVELNYVDVTTLGIAQASKALVVDADRNITNINTLEADYIQVNGTLVTSSAIELNYVDVATLGTAEASKALVVDANRDIGNIRNLTATNLTGTLQTAAQPNVTSVGTLTSLNVSGAASVGSLTVNGVPLNTFETGGLKMRVYSTPDFNGRVIKADVLTTVSFTNYEPITGVTDNYSMEIWGYIKPLYTESYTFSVSSNDKFRLWINNELVRVDWTDGTDTNLQTSPIALTANQWYPIYIQHSQSTGTEQLSVNWTSTSQTSELLPTACLAYDDKIVNVVARKSYTQDSLNLYDSTNSNLSSLAINTSGDLTLTAASSFVNIAGHNGSSTGLKLNNVLVTSTAAELNYVDTSVGAAAASKAVVLDANKDYTGIRNFTTIGNMGINTTTPASQLEINSATGDVLRLTYNDSDGSAVNYADMTISSGGNLTINSSGNTTFIHSSDNFDIAGHDGSTLGLKLNGTLVTSTAVELNYVDVTAIGTAQASKALVLDSSRNISNINVLTADTVNVTTFGAGDLTAVTIKTTGNVGINTSDLTFGLQVNHATGSNLRLTYNDPTGSTPTSKAELTMDNSNNLTITASSSVNIATHNGSTTGLKLAGTLITSTASELNYVDTTAGTAEASKALILDASRNITNINSLSASLLTSTSTTDSTSSTTGAVQIAGGVGIAKSVFIGAASSGYLELSGNASFNGDIGSTGVLTLSNATDSTTTTTGAVKIAGGVGIVKSVHIGQTLTVGGNTTLSSNLIVDGPSMRVPVGDTAARPTGVLGQVRYNSETSQFEGFGAGSTWGSLGGVSDVDQDTKILAETSAGADDDNLRFLNAGNETMRLTAASLMGLGTTAPDKKLEINSATGDVLRLTYNDANGSAANYVDMNVSSGGNLTINSSGNTTFIHSSDNLDVAGHDGSTLGLKLAGVLVTSTAAELNYVDTTAGTAEASKALVLDSSKNIIGINSISMNSLNLTFDSATANTAGNPLTVTRTTSGTPANGLGVGVSFKVENSANANIEFGNIAVVSSDITTATEDGQFVVNLLTNGVMTEAMRLSSTTLYTTEIFETSDARMKENINLASLEETHNRVMSLKLVDYNYIGQTKTRRGLLAQEVEEVIPVAVETENRNGIEDFKSVSNREITNHVVGSVQYLSAKLDETMNKLAQLMTEFEAYKQSHP